MEKPHTDSQQPLTDEYPVVEAAEHLLECHARGENVFNESRVSEAADRISGLISRVIKASKANVKARLLTP